MSFVDEHRDYKDCVGDLRRKVSQPASTMASYTGGKKVKSESVGDDGAELMNSPNEDADERRAVEEVIKMNSDKAKNAVQGATSANNSVDRGSEPGRADDRHRREPAADSLDSMKGLSYVDDDSEPQLLQEDTGPSELFPGVPCVTVAKRCKKGNDDPAPLFLNRYGPRAKGWFVWTTTPQLSPGTSVEDLQNVSERFHRVIDYPRQQGTPKYRAANVHGILNIVWDCEGLDHSPEDAVELLNPANVKRADELPTSKARRDWLKGRANRLEKYPITHIDVKFHQNITGVTQRPVAKDDGDLYDNWELGSQYKALYRKDQIKAEWRVYEAAKLQAKRFLEWFEQRHPTEFNEYRRSQSRDPTVQPFKSASPEVGDSTKTTPSPGNAPVEHGKRTSSEEPPPVQTSSGRVPSAAKGLDTETEGQEEVALTSAALSKDELKEVVLEGYCAAHDIQNAEAMTAKQKMKFDIYFEVYAKNKGY